MLKTTRLIIPMTILLAGSLACSLTAPAPTEVPAAPTTPVAQEANPTAAFTLPPATEATPTAEAPTATAAPTDTPTLEPTPTQAPGIDGSARGISFRIPEGVATGADAQLVPQNGPGEDYPAFAINPTYVQFSLEGYLNPNTLLDPVIAVYPVDAYRAISEGAAQTIDRLSAVLGEADLSAQDSLPYLPPLNAAQVLHTQAAAVSFQNGSGVRYVTQFDQAFMPVNNDEIIYTYQGLTADGRYYVSMTLPLHVSFLQDTDAFDAVPPADGLAYPDMNAADFSDQAQAYIDAIREKLAGADPQAFSPTLEQLDALAQSLTIQTVDLQ